MNETNRKEGRNEYIFDMRAHVSLKTPALILFKYYSVHVYYWAYNYDFYADQIILLGKSLRQIQTN